MDWRRTGFGPVSSVWKWTQETRTKFEPDMPIPLFVPDVIDITIYFTNMTNNFTIPVHWKSKRDGVSVVNTNVSELI